MMGFPKVGKLGEERFVDELRHAIDFADSFTGIGGSFSSCTETIYNHVSPC